jgi:hypothetical protein
LSFLSSKFQQKNTPLPLSTIILEEAIKDLTASSLDGVGKEIDMILCLHRGPRRFEIQQDRVKLIRIDIDRIPTSINVFWLSFVCDETPIDPNPSDTSIF